MTLPDGNGEAPVRVVPYDASWPALFDREQIVLELALAPWSSSSKPGLELNPESACASLE